MAAKAVIARGLVSLYQWFRGGDLDVARCLKVARMTAARTKFCFLITDNPDDGASVRLVQPICDVDDFVFWIGTNPALRKVKEIEANDQVVLAFGNAGEGANLVVYGTASLPRDPALKRRYWKWQWRGFFSGGPDGDDYAVIKVVARKMELMSFRRNVTPEPFGLRPVVLEKADDDWFLRGPASGDGGTVR